MARRVAFLVPRRDGFPDRDAAWAACKAKWERDFPKFPIVEGHHTADEGPFNRSAALNRAYAAAGEQDFYIVIDSDVFLPKKQVTAAVATAAKTGKVTWAFNGWAGLTQQATNEILRDGFPEDPSTLALEKLNETSWSCCFVVPRAVWESTGGWDERFRGWGFEDMAWQSLIVGKYGAERVAGGPVYHMWHRRSSERELENGRRHPEYLQNGILGRLYMIAERNLRTPYPDLAQDKANLERDIARCANLLSIQPPLRRPTLDELEQEVKDGAPNHYVTQPQRRFTSGQWKPSTKVNEVSVIMHTDGRREFVQQTVESFEQHVRGPIERRVFYDDSGDRRYKDWLNEEFGKYGWYHVGPDKRLGYTGSMRMMTSYIRRNCPTGYIFQTEDDFLFLEDIDLDDMVRVLRNNPDLAQLALLRAPYYDSEKAAGTILGWPQDDFRSQRDGTLVHTKFWTQNPNLAPRETYLVEWPNTHSSERVFGDRLLAEGKEFGFYKGRTTVEHIGSYRAGNRY